MIRKRHQRPIEAQPPRRKLREPRHKPRPPLVDLAVELNGYDGEVPRRAVPQHNPAFTVNSHLALITQMLRAGEPRVVPLADLQRQGFNTTPPPGLYPPGSDPNEQWMKLLGKVSDI